MAPTARASPTDVDGAPRRSSTEKKPIVEPAFERLPDEIIEQILKTADPNGFASLILLNSKWRCVSQQPHIYAHQLSRCPSYALSHPALAASSVRETNLPRLRRLFAQEVKRNLFEAYLRPRETLIKLVSNSISSSSCPGGEGMQFNPSPKGHHLLAYNSSRIYVIDVRGPGVDVKRELRILRRPVSTCIKDDGSLLAVLLTEMQVDVYDLEQSPPKRVQSIILDHSPRTIAMSPCGSILAAAYEGGIEVSLLNASGLATDRRAVKSDAVDSLAFSFDGTQLLGTTVHASPPNTVILTAPYFEPGNQLAQDNISALWTTSILFPNTSRDCSHAVLLQNASHEEASWTFTYDRSFETFRAVRIDDLRNGTTYFTGPIPSPDSQAKLIPCTLPAATYHGELVSAGFRGKDIWLYGVPEDLDAAADGASSGTESGSTLTRRNSNLARTSSSRLQESNGGRVPQWQLLCDKNRNTFVSGSKVAELDGVSNVKWVAGPEDESIKERLVIAARGLLPPKPITEEDDVGFIDGGRITLLDFDYGLTNGAKSEITIEVGTKEPEVLEEERRDMETEVAIVRRRTVAQRGGHRNALLRAATTASRQPPPPPPRNNNTDGDPLIPRRMGAVPTAEPAPVVVEDTTETESLIEEQEALEALDAPYSHASPRSGNTLRRAATAAAANRRLHPQAAAGRVEYRRADGRAEHPHESDADNWVPPPPPYQKDDPGDIPAFLRQPAIAPAASHASDTVQSQPPRTQTVQPVPNPAQIPALAVAPAAKPSALGPGPGSTTAALPHAHALRSNPVQPARESMDDPAPLASQQRVSSDSAPASHAHPNDATGPVSGRSDRVSVDDIYDVSPPDSPGIAATRRASTTTQPTRPTHPGGTLMDRSSTTPSSKPRVSPTSPSFKTAATPTLPPLQTAMAGQSRRAVPVLNTEIPSPTISNPRWSNPQQQANRGSILPGRRISAVQTWPTPPKPSSGPQTGPETGYPHSAPPTSVNADEMIAASLPPLPRPDQLASLNNHMDQNSGRRFSGGFQLQRVPVGSRGGLSSPRNSYQQPVAPVPLGLPGPSRAPQPEEQPMIISTPRGVTGAFDPPNRRPSDRRNDTPIFAPTPRHPRTASGSGPLRPTIERLETIYSVSSQNSTAAQQQQQVSNRILPTWLSAPSSSSAGWNASPSRKLSRAERSAAKNMADAKRRGWRGGKNKKKSRKNRADYDEVASSAAWTDATRSSPGLENQEKGGKKCVVM